MEERRRLAEMAAPVGRSGLAAFLDALARRRSRATGEAVRLHVLALVVGRAAARGFAPHVAVGKRLARRPGRAIAGLGAVADLPVSWRGGAVPEGRVAVSARRAAPRGRAMGGAPAWVALGRVSRLGRFIYHKVATGTRGRAGGGDSGARGYAPRRSADQDGAEPFPARWSAGRIAMSAAGPRRRAAGIGLAPHAVALGAGGLPVAAGATGLGAHAVVSGQGPSTTAVGRPREAFEQLMDDYFFRQSRLPPAAGAGFDPNLSPVWAGLKLPG